MNSESAGTHRILRLAAIAGLLGFVLHVVINFVIIAPPPPPSTPIADVAVYIASEADTLEIGNGLRHIALLLLLIFAIGLFHFVRGPQGAGYSYWSIIGILGALWHAAVGTIANGVLDVAVWRVDVLPEQSELLTLLWSLANILFNSMMVPWAVTIAGFSIAGRLSRVIPAWLVVLGLLTAVLCLLAGVGSVSVMTGGWAQSPSFAAALLVNVWIIAIGVLMLRRTRFPN